MDSPKNVMVSFTRGRIKMTHGGIAVDGLMITSAATLLNLLACNPDTFEGDVVSHINSKVNLEVSLSPDHVIGGCKVIHVWKDIESTKDIQFLSKFCKVNSYFDITESSLTSKWISYFCLIKINDRARAVEYVSEKFANSMTSAIDYHLKAGNVVRTMHTPFGMKWFFNSCCEGIVSKVLGPHGSLFLVDCRVAPNSTGSPIFTTDASHIVGRLIGMILQPLSIPSGENSGFTLSISVLPLMKGLIVSMPQTSGIPASIIPVNCIERNVFNSDIDVLDLFSSIVVIRAARCWCSGVVIGPGLVLTCAHILRESRDLIIEKGGSKYQARVILNTGDMIDISLLAFNDSDTRYIKLARSPTQGERVISVGYSLHADGSPKVSAGIISLGTDSCGDFHTSCVIHEGSSGGAILRPDGSLLGIIKGNISSRFTYPHYNTCASIDCIVPLISPFIRNMRFVTQESKL